MIVFVGAGVGWYAAKYFTSRLSESDSVQVRIPEPDRRRSESDRPADSRIAGPEGNPAQPPAPDRKDRASAAAPAKPTAANAASPKPVPVDIVNSYLRASSYDLSGWTIGKTPSGFLDIARNASGTLDPNAPTPLGVGETVELSGWAGDSSVGIRYPYVLISACGKIIGHTEVNTPRPDVGKAVHANLARSGWRARIAVQHVPVCPNIEFRAWGVAPGDRRLILPLNGKIPITVAETPGNASPDTVRQIAKPLLPKDMKPLPPIKLNVTADALNIRKCPGAGCAIVGKLAKGDWTVLMLDQLDDWILVAMPDRAGWVFKKFTKLVHKPG